MTWEILLIAATVMLGPVFTGRMDLSSLTKSVPDNFLSLAKKIAVGMPDVCSINCRNLSTFFQVPLHKSRRSLRAAGPMATKARAVQSLEVAYSASGLRAQQVALSVARSAASRRAEVRTSPTKWHESSSMETEHGAFSPVMDPPAPESWRSRELGLKSIGSSKDLAAQVEMASGSAGTSDGCGGCGSASRGAQAAAA